MTGRVMYDSVNLLGIPREGADIIAYYLNGDYQQSFDQVESLFPPDWFRYAPIDISGAQPYLARVFDVENRDISPDDCHQIITDFNVVNPSYKTGGRAVFYCNRSTIPAVRQGTGMYLLGRDYFLWVATGDGTVYDGSELEGPYAKKGVVACQNRWYRTYDSSVVFSDEWLPSPG